MFNLTVDTAHTFYVGTNGWLVHNAGRGSNNLKPDSKAFDPSGQPLPHTTYRRDPVTGKVSNYVEWSPDTRRPTGFDEKFRADMTGGSHTNKVTGVNVPTPYVHDKGFPGEVRPALPCEITK